MRSGARRPRARLDVFDPFDEGSSSLSSSPRPPVARQIVWLDYTDVLLPPLDGLSPSDDELTASADVWRHDSGPSDTSSTASASTSSSSSDVFIDQSGDTGAPRQGRGPALGGARNVNQESHVVRAPTVAALDLPRAHARTAQPVSATRPSSTFVTPGTPPAARAHAPARQFRPLHARAPRRTPLSPAIAWRTPAVHMVTPLVSAAPRAPARQVRGAMRALDARATPRAPRTPRSAPPAPQGESHGRSFVLSASRRSFSSRAFYSLPPTRRALSSSAARVGQPQPQSSTLSVAELLDADARHLIEAGAVSSAWAKRVDAAERAFVDFVRAEARTGVALARTVEGAPVSLAAAPIPLLINFLSRHSRRLPGRRTSVSAVASALVSARLRAGGLPPYHDFFWKRFARGNARLHPKGAGKLGLLPYAPHVAVSALPIRSRAFKDDRLCTLFLLRVVSMLRPGAVFTITRSSLVEFVDFLGRRVVGFNYSSKNSSNNAIAADSNYVEALSPTVDADRLVFCPARRLLAFCTRVESLPGAQSHDFLFTDRQGKPLSLDSCRRLVRDFLKSVPNIDDRHTAHGLRAASSQMLQMLGVPVEDIMVRAGWTARTASATRTEHYVRYRLVRHNFADALLFWPPVHSISVPQVD